MLDIRCIGRVPFYIVEFIIQSDSMKKAFENPKFGNSLKTCESKHQRIKMPAYNINRQFSTSSFCRTMVPACREINKAKAERDDYLSRKEAEKA